MNRLGKVLLAFVFSTLISFATPSWITKDNCYKTQNRAKVIKVIAAENADLVVINSGLQSNLRIGAICSIETEMKEPAKVVIVEATQKKCVGLVITNDEIKTGAAVYITAN